ncbi:hypothetical protein [Sorangium sp. So ce385]|uniref:hypothetical protein n=1 Tax=Sorangium sp. So ce385 TaxID=3133308 RepID=UPI003F5C0B67
MDWTTADGWVVRLGAARAKALARLARDRGAIGLLGAPPCGGACCRLPGIAQRIGRIARNARRVGVLRVSGARYPIFFDRAAGMRLLTRRLPDGAYAVLTAHPSPPAAPAPAYLGELDVREIQYDVRLPPMEARVRWHKGPLTPEQIDRVYGGKRAHLVYIPIDASGNPTKVGESGNLHQNPGGPTRRYSSRQKLQDIGVDPSNPRFYVGRVVDVSGNDLMGPYAQDAQKIIARKLDRMGVALSHHGRKNKTQTGEKIYTEGGQRIDLKSAVPRRLLRHVQQQQAKPGSGATAAQIAAAKTPRATVRGRKRYELEMP